MRRGLTLLSIGLATIGLEIATEAISTAVARLVAGTRALAAGTEYFVPPGVFTMGVGLLVGGVVLALLLAWSGRERLQIETVGRSCPHCGADTVRVRRHVVHRLLSFLLQEKLTRRHCDLCGWSGLALR